MSVHDPPRRDVAAEREERTLAERREWALAGAVTEHALPRAQVALALQGAAQNHATAEGVVVP